jgi:hypothetical protein
MLRTECSQPHVPAHSFFSYETKDLKNKNDIPMENLILLYKVVKEVLPRNESTSRIVECAFWSIAFDHNIQFSL